MVGNRIFRKIFSQRMSTRPRADRLNGIRSDGRADPRRSLDMKRRSLALTLMLVLLAAAPAPAGNDSHGCGLPAVRDPEIRASFERFDRGQSQGAAVICAIYLNNAGALFPTP
jgi:hypothetical protein